MWHEFTPARIAEDLAAIRLSGLDEVRLLLSWDVFMPTHRQVSRRRIRDLETVLDAARSVSLGVVPVLFAQSIGDCIMLPAFAVDRRRPRPGVRVISDQIIQAGGPRDMYADALMLEVETLWLGTLLDAFANHPAIAAWDLGHDPATTLRPRRIAHLAAWAELMGGLVRAREDPCRLTLGAGDVLVARGVRLGVVAPHVDVLGLAVAPQRWAAGITGSAGGLGALSFVVRLAQRLAGDVSSGAAMSIELGVATGDEPVPPTPLDRDLEASPPRWDVPLLSPVTASRFTEEALERCAEAGVAGVTAAAWSDTAERTFAAAPFDRFPSLGRQGLVDVTAQPKSPAPAWERLARDERAIAPAAPWPDQLDVDEYYASLPDSAFDLLERFRRDYGEEPRPQAD